MYDQDTEYQPSAFEIAQAQRPKTTSSRIVFPWSEKKYSKYEFNPVSTEGRITEKEIDEVLHTLENHQLAVPNHNCWYVYLFPCVLIVIWMVIISRVFGDPEKEKGLYSVVVFLFIVAVLVAFCCVLTCLGKRNLKRWNMREREFGLILKELNEKEFSSRGVEWRVGRYGAWICLELNFVLMQRNQAYNFTNGFTVETIPINQIDVPVYQAKA